MFILKYFLYAVSNAANNNKTLNGSLKFYVCYVYLNLLISKNIISENYLLVSSRLNKVREIPHSCIFKYSLLHCTFW